MKRGRKPIYNTEEERLTAYREQVRIGALSYYHRKKNEKLNPNCEYVMDIIGNMSNDNKIKLYEELKRFIPISVQ